MNKLNGLYASLLLAGLLGFSACTEEDREMGQSEKKISLEIPVEVLGMENAGDGAVTRSIDGSLEMTFGAEGVDTRSAMDATEKKVNNLCVVQFNGTATGSKAVAYKAGISRDPSNRILFTDFLATDAASRVYVLANITPSITLNTTTLGDFEKTLAAYSSHTSVATAGLPMCGYADFNPKNVTTIPTIQLKAMVAKLVVTYTVSGTNLFKAGTTPTLKLINLPSGSAYGIPANVNTAYKPTGVTYSDKAVGNIGTTYTFYVPENIAGANSAASTWVKRTVDNIPSGTNPLYFEITGRTYDDKNTATIVSFIGDPAKPTEFNILRNTAYTLTANIKNLSTTDERITVTPDFFNLNVGGKSANCYVVTGKENGTTVDYGFDATVRGNNATGVGGISYGSLPALTGASEARVIWETGGANSVIKSVKLDNGKVLFTVGTATEGNAVIGIFASSAANAECLWSWHIWRLNGSAPTNVACVKTPSPVGASANFTMMDRNLGAYNNTSNNTNAIGLLYQWGRKDPFPGPAGFNTTEPSNIYGSFNNGGTTGSWSGTYSIKTSTTNATIGTEAWAVKYPTAFIIGTSANGSYDWYWGSTRNDNLWGTPWVAAGSVGSYNGSQGTKSIYDPCPIGYRVPPQDTWNKAVNGWGNNGSAFTGMVTSGSFWFPAAGYRNLSSGGLSNSPGNGYYWSSSPHGSFPERGGYLYFYSSSVYPQNYNYRAFGFSVRCVSE